MDRNNACVNLKFSKDIAQPIPLPYKLWDLFIMWTLKKT